MTTRKHYEAVAKLLRYSTAGQRDKAVIAMGLANLYYEDNKRFDGAKFITASGLADDLEWHEGFASKEARLKSNHPSRGEVLARLQEIADVEGWEA